MLDTPEILIKDVQQLVREEKDIFNQIRRNPIVVGEFYEIGIVEHSQMVTFLGLLLAHRHDTLDVPQDKLEEFKELEAEFTKFLEEEDEKKLVSNLFAGYYTLYRSILAINTCGKPINQLLDEGLMNNDSMPLKQAVKFDPIAIASPQLSSMLMMAELQGKKKLRTELHNALKNPHSIERVPYPKLHHLVWALKEDGLYHDMSEIERYEFLHEKLGLYKVKAEDHFDSFSRLLRTWL